MILNSKDSKVQIVYSGGDDMFLIGAWNHIIDAATSINQAFKIFSQSTLTISAGIGIFSSSYPIARMASNTADLESEAKSVDLDKNKICLFTSDWVIKWNQLPLIGEFVQSAKGIQNKLNMLRVAFNNSSEKGKSFLYKILDLLRQSKDSPINIARYAYLLKRTENEKANIDVAAFYSFIQNANDRQELEIAITLYTYETRTN